MLQYRRTSITILVTLSLVYLYTLHSNLRDYSSPPWTHLTLDGENVLNNTLGFAEIFVINLPSRRDRRHAMAMAGAVSNLSFTFLEGLTGDSVPASSSAGKGTGKERDGGKPSRSGSAGARGSWHSHMNAMQIIVTRGLGSALVLEDDVDWDVRLKMQMGTFAKATVMWLDAEKEKRKLVSRWQSQRATNLPVGGSLESSLSEERGGPGSDLELDYRRPGEEELKRDAIPVPPKLLSNNMGRRIHTGSAYGDGWDVLWLGHCGADLPLEPPPALTISIPNDNTVPAPKHLKPHPFALHDKLGEEYAAHTRVVHAANGNVCSLAYAVSHRGARRLLRRLGREGFVDQWDLMLRDYCMGGYEDRAGEHESSKEEAGGPPVCLTVQPPLISHHYAGDEGASVSDIRGQGGGLARGKKGTPYVRLSVQENLSRLVAGFPENSLVDQLPDDGDPLW
ncbi:hypothetical protein F4803DRAFT_528661 [Xylaria telfairii]|nr:hypothetical protein F4803DRAFT_528661 [Xylaria telfairii]